jgi:hypothetical protein
MRITTALMGSAAAVAIMGCAGCGTLGSVTQLIQPPRFVQTPSRAADVRFVAPSPSHPAGGAGVTVWVDMTNPNPFSFTLGTIDATLLVEGNRAATGMLPLGLPLLAGQTSTIPIDLSISFTDLPALADAVRQVSSGGRAAFELDGTIGVDAGAHGQPTFGPLRLAAGELRVR